ncbi:hypothetical protein H0H87_009549 [Tephrocybe sp. NHM501043]|nr:hypothetical protein H0H87_009549 [Tephrocybe sp. NHM501043]
MPSIRSMFLITASAFAALCSAAAVADTLTIGKVVVDVTLLVEVLNEVKVIFRGALDVVKLIVNNLIEVILTLEGKVLAVVDICEILLAILTVSRLPITISANPLLTGPPSLSAVLVELLVWILKLLLGLLVALHPLLTPISSIFVGLKLDAVVEVLHGQL